MELNQENSKMYQDFLDAKHRKFLGDHRALCDSIMLFGCITIFLSGFIGTSFLTLELQSIFESIVIKSAVQGIILGGYIGIAIATFCVGLPKVVDGILMGRFKKKYPNFDTSIDIETVEKELEKYHELSRHSKDIENKKAPKNIEEMKKEHLSSYQEHMQEVATEEMLEFLKEEKEFWESVLKEEKLDAAMEIDNTKPIEKNPEKTIGSL